MKLILSFVLKDKWILLVAFVLFVLFLPVVLVLTNKRSPHQYSQNALFAPTPTSFIITNTKVVSTSPVENSTNIRLDSAISATFSRPLSSQEQSFVSFYLSPQASGSAIWSSDDTTVTFQEPSLLLSNTVYTATISYSGYSFTWKFTTQSLDPSSPDYGLQQQGVNDERWNMDQQTTQTSFPWYNSLPISGNKYFTVFNTDTQTFETDIYTDSASSDSQDVQVSKMKSEVLNKLSQLGVDITKYKFSWSINPTPVP